MGRIRSMGGIASGNIMYEGLDLVTCTEKQWREIRWKKLALVPQSSMNSFNPIYTIGKTLDEMYRIHMPNLSKQEKKERKLQLMSMVHLEERVLNCYPHELSGGMRPVSYTHLQFKEQRENPALIWMTSKKSPITGKMFVLFTANLNPV